MNDGMEYRLVSTDKTTGTISRWYWDTEIQANKLMSFAKGIFPNAIYNIQRRKKVKRYKPVNHYKPKYKSTW